MSDELLPDDDELLQRADPPMLSTVPVRVVEMPPERQAPALAGQHWMQMVTNTVVEPLVDGDPRRSKVTLWCLGQELLIGTDRDAVKGGTAAVLMRDTPLVITHRGPLYARLYTGAEAVVSAVVERWAD